MSLYPILIEWKNMPVLVAGGGEIARHKAELLASRGAAVTVVSSSFVPGIETLPVQTVRRRVVPEDAEGKMLVVDATGNPEAEEMLSSYCAQRGIPYNCTGHGEACTAIFSAVYTKGRTMLSVSSQGASPVASAWLRDRLAEEIPEKLDDILEEMAALRPVSRRLFDDQAVRKLFLHRCFERMMAENRTLSEEDIEEIRKTTV